jgi:hypothetical protein
LAETSLGTGTTTSPRSRSGRESTNWLYLQKFFRFKGVRRIADSRQYEGAGQIRGRNVSAVNACFYRE